MQMSDEERRARLVRWLARITSDVDDLARRERVFQEVQRIIEANSELHDAPGLFNRSIAANYGDAVALGIRRHIKVRKGSVTLMRFLEEVRDYPHLVSRERHLVGLEDADAVIREIHAREFDSAAGTASGQVDPSNVTDEMNELRRVSKVVESYVDTQRAHIDETAEGDPKFDDLTASLQLLKRIVVKYSLLVDGVDRRESIGEPRDPRWTDVFNAAWKRPQT